MEPVSGRLQGCGRWKLVWKHFFDRGQKKYVKPYGKLTLKKMKLYIVSHFFDVYSVWRDLQILVNHYMILQDIQDITGYYRFMFGPRFAH